MTRFTTLTLGDAPRTDLAPAFEAVAPQGTEVMHAGLLNGLDPEEAARNFAPVGSEARFTTKFRSGAAVTVGRRAVVQGLRTRIQELEADGADLILLLCNDAFDELDDPAAALQSDEKTSRRAHLLQPGRLLPAVCAPQPKARGRRRSAARARHPASGEVARPREDDASRRGAALFNDEGGACRRRTGARRSGRRSARPRLHELRRSTAADLRRGRGRARPGVEERHGGLGPHAPLKRCSADSPPPDD